MSNQNSQTIEAKRQELKDLTLFLLKTKKELASIVQETARLQIETQTYLDKHALHRALQAIHSQK